MAVISFYSASGRYGCFSNFSAHPVTFDGLIWPTSEHCFQAQKFHDPAIREQIRTAPSPGEAAKLGRSRSFPLREDWEDIKDEIMYQVVRAKFGQHEDIRATLLGTGDDRLLEHTERDSYWGDGGDGSGLNRLGQILMRVRAELREAD